MEPNRLPNSEVLVQPHLDPGPTTGGCGGLAPTCVARGSRGGGDSYGAPRGGGAGEAPPKQNFTCNLPL